MWSIAVYIFIPIPLTILVLLGLPLPRSIHIAVAGLVDRIFGLRVLGFTLYRFLLMVALLLFASTSFEAWHRGKYTKGLSPKADFELHLQAHGKKWRAERNFWLSLLSVVVWLVLERMVDLTKRCLDLKANLDASRQDASERKKDD